jgi:hypothetical protein
MAEADRGRHSGFPSFNVVQESPISLAQRFQSNPNLCRMPRQSGSGPFIRHDRGARGIDFLTFGKELAVIHHEEQFDFHSWLANRNVTSFQKCVRAAANELTLGSEDLRGRIEGAIFCLSGCDERDVPESVRVEFDAIYQEIRDRFGRDIPGFRLRDVDYLELRKWARKCKLRTSRRIAEYIVKIDRTLRCP